MTPRRNLPLAFVLLLVAASWPAAAAFAQSAAAPAGDTEQADPIDAAYSACVEKDPSTAGMVGCADAAFTAWDKALNDAYQRLLKELKGTAGEAALRTAQRAWVTQRDAEFKLQDAVHGLLQGTMWGPVMADHRVTLVKTRVQQLRAYLSALEDGRG